jgi:Tol biopolymer transport system component
MDPQLVRGQLQRIIASRNFAESERAQRFLRFVVEQSLTGQSNSIKETVIAVEVLGRNPAFDPRTDPIVRVEAGRLRSRLSAYYDSIGKEDKVVISLPKGGYVPHFAKRDEPQALRVSGPRLLWVLTALLAIAFSVIFILLWSLNSRTPPQQLIRLSLLSPGTGPLQASAISPDGRYLAFAANGGVWIRPLDREESRQLPGTGSASNPFWSPNSRTIAFFTPGKLKRIDVSGGSPQDICDVDIGRGGSWGSTDIVIFAPRPGGGLSQVAARGGKPTPLTKPDLSQAEVSHTFPHFMPDGRRFLYSVLNKTGDSSIRLASLDDPKGKFLVNGEPGAIYTTNFGPFPSLIYVYRGALLAQPVNSTSLQPRGEPSIIASAVRIGADRSNASISANGILAFEPGRTKDQQLTWLDRTGKTLSTIGPRNSYYTWALAPDQKHVAVQDGPFGSESQSSLWILDTERGSLAKVPTHGNQSFSPVWSPDSSEIVFGDGTHESMALIRQRLDNTTPVSVLQSGGIKVPSDWSADGKFVAYFTSWPDFKRLSVWVAPASSFGPDMSRRLSSISANEFGATFSPAASRQGTRWIAYCSNETGRREVYVRDFPAGLHKGIISNGGGATPHWRQDGQELFYVAPNGFLMSVRVGIGKDRLGFGPPEPLFDTGITSGAMAFRDLPVNTYAVGRDGQQVLINRLVDPQPPSITIVTRR